MKSAVFYGKRDLRVEDSPEPEPGRTEVLIQVAACGVCGTDVHIFDGDKGAADVTPPTILGHEFAGTVTRVGEDVTGVRVGDRVCVDPNRYCGKCEPCRSGAVHFCQHMVGYGTTVNGGFAQFCAVDERQVYVLGENTSFEAGAMTEPLACCVHGIDMCGITPGSTAVVIGGGMIGLLMLQLAKLSGAARVALIEPVAAKRAVAESLGADLTVDPVAEDASAALRRAGYGWVNTVIECVGRPSTIEQAIDIAGPQAVVMMFGLTKPDEVISIKPFDVFRKEIVLKASYINPCTHGRALALIDSGRIDVTSMVAELAPLEKLPEILSTPALRAKGKYIIRL